MILMVLVPLAVLGIFTLGTLFGAWIVESDHKAEKKRQRIPLVHLVEYAEPPKVIFVGPEEVAA